MNCPKCGAEIAANAAFCEYCGQALEQQAAPQNIVTAPQMSGQQAAPAAPVKKENVVAGIVGALIGAAIGAGAIILVGYLGYVASICGLILAVCTVKGYELLGGKLSIKGAIICVVLMALAPYIADRISWAIAIVDAFKDEGVTFGMAFAAVHDVVKENGLVGDYFKDLALLYVFALLGAFSTLRGLFTKK